MRALAALPPDLHADSYGDPVRVDVEVDTDDGALRVVAFCWEDGEVEALRGSLAGYALLDEEVEARRVEWAGVVREQAAMRFAWRGR